MEKIMLKAVLVLFGQMGIQLKFTAMVNMMELSTLGGKNVAPGMDLNVNQRVTNSNSSSTNSSTLTNLDIYWDVPTSLAIVCFIC